MSSTHSRHLGAEVVTKEAVMKVLRVRHDTPLLFTDIEIALEESGAPYVVLHGLARQLAVAQRLTELTVSLSHDGNTAFAQSRGSGL